MTELEDFFATRNFEGSNSGDSQVIGTKAHPFKRIFLCGGNDDDNFRTKLHTHLEGRGYNVVKIETILKDWYAAQNFKSDLLELEKYFAALVSIIPIVSESIGSAAEIGAFVSDIHIRKKLFIIIEDQYYSGNNNKSFIRYGPIKNHVDKNYADNNSSGVYEIDDDNPENDLETLANSILDHKPLQSKCDFKLGYFQILLLADIISALVICDRDEIKSHFKYAMERAFPNKKEFNFACKIFDNELDNMLSVLNLLEIIKIKNYGEEYYIVRHSGWFLHYRSKDSNNYKNITNVKEQILDNIYSDNGKKAFILEKDVIEGTIAWLKHDKIREELIRKAPLLYKVYDIPKKGKGKGTRTIAQPTPKLKKLQGKTLKKIQEEKKLPVHPCAKAYIKGVNGILANAEAHKDSKYFFKYDFKNFFPSIKAADFNIQLKNAGYNEQDRIDFLRIFFRFDKKATRKNHQDAYNALLNKNSALKTNLDTLNLIIEDYKDEFQLSIGAPSSPFISNAIMFDFDTRMDNWAKANDFIYTRFADDITISCQKKENTETITAKLNETLKGLEYPKLRLNNKKQKSVSLKSRVTITGLNITSEHKVSLGRKKKKDISAMIHHYKDKRPLKYKMSELRGWLAYAYAVDNNFFKSMQKKYTPECIASIMQSPK